MPGAEVCFYADRDGSCPFLDWLEEQDERVKVKMLERVSRLRDVGFKLGPPLAKPLGDGINELRVRRGRAQYRALYFFSEGRAVIAHGFTKRGKKVPAVEIQRCVDRRRAFEREPDAHIYTVRGEVPNGDWEGEARRGKHSEGPPEEDQPEAGSAT